MMINDDDDGDDDDDASAKKGVIHKLGSFPLSVPFHDHPAIANF